MGFKKSFGNIARRFSFEVGIGLFLLVAGLFVLTGISFKQRILWVDHTYQVLADLFDLSSHLERAETTQRGYFISGDHEFLVTYKQSVAELRSTIQTTKQLVSNNPVQYERISKIEELVKTRISMMDAIIQMRKQNRIKEAQVIISNPERRKFTESIRQEIKDSIEHEQGLLTERSEQANTTERSLVFLVVFGAGLALLLLVISRLLMNRDNKKITESFDDLEKQERLLDSIINTMSEGLIVAKVGGGYSKMNLAAEAVLGPREDVLATKNIIADVGFFHPETGKTIDVEDLPTRRALRGLPSDNFEILIRNHKHPQGLVINSNGRPLFDKDGEIIGALSVFRDVSRQKEIEKERISAREAAIEASKKKSDFLATMSHEIRTPMNGIIGMSRLMLDTKMTSEQFEFVATIKKSAESLLGLINGILDHSKIESGKLVLQRFDFDFQQSVNDVYEMFKYQAAEKNIQFKVIAEENTSWAYQGDADRVRQILMNLIGNAIKFTDKGGVEVRFFKKFEDGEKTRIRCEIHDTGPGLSAPDISQIFGKYIQTAAGQAKGGSGLGLMISKQLSQLMHGEMGVTSEVGKGSCFWFEIVLEESTKKIIPQVRTENVYPQLKGHVLLVEDQPINIRLAGKFLENMNLTYQVAENGKIAVDHYQTGNFDLILMDCRMPVMNGYEATKAIRLIQLERQHRVPIIALTAEGSSGERRLCIEAGMDDVVSKPIDVERFVSKVSEFLNGTGIIDQSVLNKLKGLKSGDQDLISALIEDFSEGAPRLIKGMKSSILEKDLGQLQDYAHAMKSTCSALGALQLAKRCQSIEDLEAMPQNIADLVAEIESAFKVVLGELQSRPRRSSSQAS